MIKVGIINKSKNELPKYANDGDSGMDIRAHLDRSTIIPAFSRKLIPTGIYVNLPKGYEIQVRPRSGLALKDGIIVLNTPGTIDEGYKNEIGIILFNTTPDSYIVSTGDRIAQLVFAPVTKAEWEITDSLGTSERGLGGFGSSGIK